MKFISFSPTKRTQGMVSLPKPETAVV